MSKRTASAPNGGQTSSGFPVFTGLDCEASEPVAELTRRADAKFFAAGALCCTVTHGMTSTSPQMP